MGFSCFYGAEKVLNSDCHFSGNPVTSEKSEKLAS